MSKKTLNNYVAIFLMFICILVTGIINGKNIAAKTNDDELTEEYVIKFKEEYAYKEMMGEYDEYIVGESDCDQILKNNNTMVVELTENMIDDLDDKEYYIEENNMIFSGLQTDNNGLYKDILQRKQHNNIFACEKMWNMDMINADIICEKKGNNKVKVAILDSGIDDCVDIEVKERADFLSDENQELNMFDDLSGHGTSIAGLMAAQRNGQGMVGVNPNIELYSAKILDANNRANLSRVLQGIYWAIEKKVDIINISFGTPEYSQILEAAIQDATDQGILVIAAAGNNKIVEYPAAFNDVVSVGAVDSEGEVCEFSADETKVDILAPGERVICSSSFDGLMVQSGTSLAVPQVVGAASLLMEKDKNISAHLISEILIDTSNDTGILDVNNALQNYSSYVKLYKQKKPLKKELVNKATEPVCCNTDALVEGSWTYKIHYESGDYATTDSEWLYTSEDIKYIKIGTLIADEILAGYSTTTSGSHPYFHGNYNYIACYIYLADLSWSLYNAGSGVTLDFLVDATPWEIIETSWTTSMKNDLKKIQWSNIPNLNCIKQYGLDKLSVNTKKKKALVILGLCLHSSADAFAHRTWIKESTQVYTRLTHEGFGKDEAGHWWCDNKDFYPKRYSCAKEVIRDIARNWDTPKYGYKHSWLEFWQDYKSLAGDSFKMDKMYQYATKVAPDEIVGDVANMFKFIDVDY